MAVKVTLFPFIDGLADEISVVVVDALFTTWLKTADELAVKFASPAYVAVMLKVLALRPMPFVVSFTSYFIALYFVEALGLRRLMMATGVGAAR